MQQTPESAINKTEHLYNEDLLNLSLIAIKEHKLTQFVDLPNELLLQIFVTNLRSVNQVRGNSIFDFLVTLTRINARIRALICTSSRLILGIISPNTENFCSAQILLAAYRQESFIDIKLYFRSERFLKIDTKTLGRFFINCPNLRTFAVHFDLQTPYFQLVDFTKYLSEIEIVCDLKSISLSDGLFHNLSADQLQQALKFPPSWEVHPKLCDCKRAIIDFVDVYYCNNCDIIIPDACHKCQGERTCEGYSDCEGYICGACSVEMKCIECNYYVCIDCTDQSCNRYRNLFRERFIEREMYLTDCGRGICEECSCGCDICNG
jgi:hypothetical protein